MTLALTLIVLHFIGDFLLQSDWMATNKSKRWDALTLHVGAYMAPFWAWVTFVANVSSVRLVWWLIANFALHFITDAITSRITSRLWFFERRAGIWIQAPYTAPKHNGEIVNPWTPTVGNRHWFFVVIGFDQVLHYCALLLTWEWLVQ